MLDVWELLKNVDWTSKLQPILASIEATDPRFVALLVVILGYLGSKMVSGQPTLRALGLRLALVAFLLYGGYAYYDTAGTEPRDYLTIGLRAFNAGAGVLAFTWITLPILTFVYNHLRLALAAFLGYGVYAIIRNGSFDTEQLPWIAAQGMIAVALTLIAAWIVHPIWDFIKELLPKPAVAPQPAAPPPAPVAPAQIVSPQIVPPPAPLPPPLPPALPPDYTHWQQHRLVQSLPPEPPVQHPPAIAVSPLEMETQRRRDKIRLRIELAYLMAMPAIASRFPRPVFDDFVHRYLGDHLPADDVEENGRQLEMILHEHQRQAQQAQESRSLLILQEHQQHVPQARPLEDMLRNLLEEHKRPTALPLEHINGNHHVRPAELPPHHAADESMSN
ncbi:MAG: hypothetical protein JNM56_03605 [Planctomycetia bacterium]|nr:hypothetical protein [Planctomycetia bacterium]